MTPTQAITHKNMRFVVRGSRILREKDGRVFYCAQSLARVKELWPIPTAVNYSVSLNGSRRAAR